jgi:hypothetical protein
MELVVQTLPHAVLVDELEQLLFDSCASLHFDFSSSAAQDLVARLEIGIAPRQPRRRTCRRDEVC